MTSPQIGTTRERPQVLLLDITSFVNRTKQPPPPKTKQNKKLHTKEQMHKKKEEIISTDTQVMKKQANISPKFTIPQRN